MFKELETPIEVKMTRKYREGRKKAGYVLVVIMLLFSILPIGFWVTTFYAYSQSPALSCLLGFFAAGFTYMVIIGIREGLDPEDMRNLPPLD